MEKLRLAREDYDNLDRLEAALFSLSAEGKRLTDPLFDEQQGGYIVISKEKLKQIAELSVINTFKAGQMLGRILLSIMDRNPEVWPPTEEKNRAVVRETRPAAVPGG